jgi:hypothetical protein
VRAGFGRLSMCEQGGEGARERELARERERREIDSERERREKERERKILESERGVGVTYVVKF